jgi:hypothetical protein
MRSPRSNNGDKLHSALQHARRGFRVFPVHSVHDGHCTCGKHKCGSPGKHPRIKAWQTAATTNADEIRAWWKRWPDANIGIATGSGIVVLDIDPRNGGLESLNALESANAPLPPTLTARTGRGDGGKHLFFRSSEHVPNRELAPGIDLQSDGKFVVAAGSDHLFGGKYAWEDSTVPLAPLPMWVQQLVGSPRERDDHGRGDRAEPHQQARAGIDWVSHVRAWLRGRYGSERIPDGRRNKTLFKRVAGLLRGYGLSGPEIVGILQDCNQALCDPPMPEPDFEKFGEWIEEKWPRGRRRDLNLGQRITQMHAAARASTWMGKPGLSAFKCLLSLLLLAEQTGNGDIGISVRRLGLLAGMDKRTAAKARTLLCRRGWLERITRARQGRSGVYRLRLPPALANATVLHAGGRQVEAQGKDERRGKDTLTVPFESAGEGLDADEYRWRGFGPVGWLLLEELKNRTWASAAELARSLQLKTPTVRRQLQRLQKQALAVKDATGWHRGTGQVALTYALRRRDELKHFWHLDLPCCSLPPASKANKANQVPLRSLCSPNSPPLCIGTWL